MLERRVLVVGTTPDYIAHITERYPGRALFLIDESQYSASASSRPDVSSGVVTRLADTGGAIEAVRKHLKAKRQTLAGVACYDCEWLVLAAESAEYFDLPFPSVESVQLSRDKYLTKKIWSKNGIRCPEVELIHSVGQALGIVKQFGSPAVLKPITGSGSELTFRCDDVYDVAIAYRGLTEGLVHRSDSPLYWPDSGISDGNLLRPTILAEEFIEGREYSADFIIHDYDVTLIRVAKKLGSSALPFGTTMGYVVPARLPGWVNHESLINNLREATHALGLTQAVCMVDFIISKNEIVFLELSPRIGGDCLPPLIRASCGLDTIGMALDLAEGVNCEVPLPDKWTECVGMRLFSPANGTLANVSCRTLSNDPRIREVFVKRVPGHEISMPPDDYESWDLGHVIFEPEPGACPRKQSDDIRKKITISVEQYRDQTFAWISNESGQHAQSPDPAA